MCEVGGNARTSIFLMRAIMRFSSATPWLSWLSENSSA